MSEWWSYRPSDFLLFAPQTYYRLFELYNLAIWPGQSLALAAGLAVVASLRRPSPARGRLVAAILAAFWLWVAWSYFLTRYQTINWAATYFAAGFALEAGLLVLIGAMGGGLAFGANPDGPRRVGLGLFLFALLIQPWIGPLLGRAWAGVEIVGVAPDPTAVATLGLLLAAERLRWELLAIPVLWCAISGAILWTMDSPDALLPPLAALLALLLSGWKARSPSSPAGGRPASRAEWRGKANKKTNFRQGRP